MNDIEAEDTLNENQLIDKKKQKSNWKRVYKNHPNNNGAMGGHIEHNDKDLHYMEDFLKHCVKFHLKTKGNVVCEWGTGICRATAILKPYFSTIHLNDIVGDQPNVVEAMKELK